MIGRRAFCFNVDAIAGRELLGNLKARRKCLEEGVTPSDLPGFVLTSVLTPRIFEGISRRFYL
jgi:hypothetical protein